MKNFPILQAGEDDLMQVLALRKEAFRAVAEQMNTCDLPPLRQTLPDILKEYRQGIILKCVAEDGRIIGSVRGYRDKNGICCVGKLVVHPAWQNRGIGKALLYEMERYFPSCYTFSLFTSPETPATRYMYEQVGYRTVGTQEIDGIPMLIMEKEKIG